MNRILFAASEGVPFIKTGGLADVVGALPKAFDNDKWDVRVVLPFYTCIGEEYRQKAEYITNFYMDLGDRGEKYVGVFSYVHDSITFYFIDNLEYFDCFYPYGDIKWDIEKFTFFSKAVLSILPVIGFKPDIIHCNDWQTGLIPVYLKTLFRGNMYYWNIKSIITIHNLRFQGMWDIETIQGISGLPKDIFTPDKLEFNKGANMLKGGLVYADYITTVSPSYSNEIQMDYFGEGLSGLLRARHFDMQGIVNGIDYDAYNPATDKSISTQYSVSDFREKKKKNKLALQEQLGLDQDSKKFMIGFVSRLTSQKGIDLIAYCLDRILDGNTQLVVLGTGEYQYEEMFRYFASKHPSDISVNTFYSEDLSRQIYAGSDAFLMPSAFEPCGLTQMISLRYGTVPIVRETGGLRDTVEPYNEFEKTGDGFSFRNFNGDELLDSINYAKTVFFERKRQWNEIISRGMKKDLSWNNSMEKYVDLYNFLLGV